MRISVMATRNEERIGLFQKLRLARPQIVHNARIDLKLSADEALAAQRLDRKTLEAWAGAKLKDLVSEFERAGRSQGVGAEVKIAKSLDCPEEADALKRRAAIFEGLVKFALAEQRLADEARRGLSLEPSTPGVGAAKIQEPSAGDVADNY